MTVRGISCVLALILVLLLPCTAQAQIYTDADRRAEFALVDSLATELHPMICELAGFEIGEPVPIEIWTRSELRARVREEAEEMFPGDEWVKLSRMLAELGLLPRGYDMQKGLLELLVDQAGSGYDIMTDTYISLIDMPSGMKTPFYRRAVISHELTHAMQDRVIDMVAMYYEDLASLDRSYAHRCVFEGMASMVMLSCAMGLPLSALPDVEAFMQQNFGRTAADLAGRGGHAPVSLIVDYLIKPYIEGSGFTQSVCKAHPDEPLVNLLHNMPVSGEQVLHVEKYLDGEVPAEINLTGYEELIPGDWQPYHVNELGEQDLRLLCEIHGIDKGGAALAVEGWNGFPVASFTNQHDSLAVVGISAWDSEEDAVQFADAFEPILRTLHGEDSYLLEVEGSRVRFATGLARETARRILAYRPPID